MPHKWICNRTGVAIREYLTKGKGRPHNFLHNNVELHSVTGTTPVKLRQAPHRTNNYCYLIVCPRMHKSNVLATVVQWFLAIAFVVIFPTSCDLVGTCRWIELFLSLENCFESFQLILLLLNFYCGLFACISFTLLLVFSLLLFKFFGGFLHFFDFAL